MARLDKTDGQLEIVKAAVRDIDEWSSFKVETSTEIINDVETVVKVCAIWEVPLDEYHDGMEKIITNVYTRSDDE